MFNKMASNGIDSNVMLVSINLMLSNVVKKFNKETDYSSIIV
jgi:hypothetical protein